MGKHQMIRYQPDEKWQRKQDLSAAVEKLLVAAEAWYHDPEYDGSTADELCRKIADWIRVRTDTE